MKLVACGFLTYLCLRLFVSLPHPPRCQQYEQKDSVVPRLIGLLLAQAFLMLAIPEVAMNIHHEYTMVITFVLIALSGAIAQALISCVVSFGSSLPRAGMQAVMVGLGGAGFLAAAARIVTKVWMPNAMHSGLAFYLVACGVTALACASMIWLDHQYYTEYFLDKAVNSAPRSARSHSSGRRVWAPLIPDVEQGEAGGT